jgi:hypothetical protein
MALRSYGYGSALLPVSEAAPQGSANRVEFRRGALTEWYANGPLGLEQGFTLTRPPGEANGEPLTVALALTGDLTASLDPDGTVLTLTRGDGQAALRYSGLTAYDAAGRELQAWLELRGERLLVRVKDTGARYPLVIDPFVQQAKLTASDGAAYDFFGESVAISGDTVVVGAHLAKIGSNLYQGAAYVFVKPGTGWATTSTFDAKLTASDGALGDYLGYSVAISSDTVVVGAPYADVGSNSGQGAAYVFVEPGTGWATTSSYDAKLTASDGAANDNFGYSVGVSGETVAVGAFSATVGSNVEQGTAYVFTAALDQAPAITSTNNTTFQVGVGGSFTVTTTGTPTPSLTESGALPSGVTFHDNGDSTGTLSGTPAAGTGGTYPITFTAHNGAGTDDTQNFTLTVNQAPAITSASSTTFAVNTAGSFTVTTTGTPTPSITESGALPGGVTFHDNGNGTGTLSGTPGAGTSGTYPISFTAHNGAGTDATQTFTLKVGDFTISATPASQTVSSGHSAAYTISLTSQGGLTGNVTLSCSGGPPNSTCAISPSSVMLNGTAKATVSFSPAKNVNHGTFTLTFTGKLGNLSHSTNVSLTVK